MIELTLDRPLPACLEAERLVLGSLLTGTLSTAQARAVIAAEDLSTESHRRIFTAICQLDDRGEAINYVSVFEALQACGWDESCGGLGYLVDLRSEALSINLEAYLRRIHETSVLRQAIRAAEKFIQQCLTAHDPPAELLGKAERTLRELSTAVARDGKLRSLEQIIAAEPRGLDGVLAPNLLEPGICTPWPGLNRLITGLRPGQLFVVGGRPGTGKTSFAVQLACHAAQRGYQAAYFSFEMAASEIVQRAGCTVGRVDSHKLRSGCLTQSEREALLIALSSIKDHLLIYDAPGASVGAIRSAAQKCAATRGLDLIVVDYLQLMESPGRRENRVQEISEITRGLKLLAHDLNVPVLALAQLNRASENEHRRPVLSDLRDSGSIEQDADVVLMLHRDQERPDSPEEFIVRKQRNGPTGTIFVRFNPRFTRFEELLPENN